MSNYKELIGLLEHPVDGRDSADLMICAAKAIKQLIKECSDYAEAADGFQHDFFEKCRECAELKEERNKLEELLRYRPVKTEVIHFDCCDDGTNRGRWG